MAEVKFQILPTTYNCDAPLFWGARADGSAHFSREDSSGQFVTQVSFPHAVILLDGELSQFDADMRANHDHGERCRT